MWLRWILFWIVIAGTIIDVGAQTLTLDALKYGGGDGEGFDRSGIFYTVVAAGPEKACSGEEVVYNVEVIGAESYTYQWKYNGSFLSSGKTLVLKNVSESQTGKYWCEVSDPGGKVKVKSREFDLVVSHTPAFELSASKLSITRGDSACLKARGDAANTYLWHTGQMTDSIWVKPSLSEKYIVTASNGTQCRSTKNISIEVKDLEIEYQRFSYISKGGETVLKIKSNADSVQWYEKTSVYFRSASSQIYLGTGDSIVVSPQRTTDYEALIYYNGYQLSRTLTVDVRQSRAFQGGKDDGFNLSALFFKASISVSPNPVCENATAVFKATATGLENYTYSWRKVGKNGTLSDSSVLVVDPVLPRDSGRYYCVLTEPQGKFKVYTDTLYLEVIPKPEVSIVSPLADTTICYGDVALLRGKAVDDEVNMTWSGENIVSVPVMDYVEVAPLAYQKYVLTGERRGCLYADIVGVSVVDGRIDIPSVYHLTNGVQQSVSALSLMGDTLEANQVNWFMNGILSAEKVNPYAFYAWNDVSLIAEYTTTGTVCKFRDSAQIFVRNLEPYAGGDNDGFTRTSINFGLTTNIDPNPVCEGETVTFYTTATGIENYSYKWYKVGVATPLEESCCFTIDAVTLSDSGLYYCEVMAKGVRALEPDTIRLVVYPYPQISFDWSSKDTTICYGNSLVIKGNSSLPDSKYAWSGNAIEGIAYTDAVKVKPLERTVYSLTVEKNGCATTDTFAVDVNDSRIYLPDVYNATQGEMAMFTANNGLGDTVPSAGLKWYVGDVMYGEKVNPFSKLVTDQETVRAEYTNGYCVFADSIRVSVKQNHAYIGGKDDGFSRTGINFGVTLEITPNPVCQYDAVTFQAATIGIEKYNYKWYKVGSNVPVRDTCCFTIESVDLSDAGLYYCAITDGNSKMTALDTLELVVHERPVPTIDPVLQDTVICYGDVLTLHGTSSMPGSRFTWSGPALVNNPYAESIEVMPLENQKYMLTVEKEGCTQTDTVSVLVKDTRIVLPDVYSATEGEMAMISAHTFAGDTVPSADLEWYIGNSLVGDHVNPFSHLAVQPQVVRAIYTSGHCVFIDSTRIVIKKNYAFYGGENDGYARTGINFGVTTDIDPNPVCEGESVTFAATATGIENYIYEWHKVGMADPIKDSCCFTIEAAALSDSGRYYCVVKDISGRSVFEPDTLTLVVNERPHVVFASASKDTLICYGDEVVIRGGSSLPESHYSWAGTATVGSVYVDSLVAKPLQQTMYALTVEKEGCTATDTFVVNINDSRVFLPETYYGGEGELAGFAGLDKTRDTLSAEGMMWYREDIKVGDNINPIQFLLTDNTTLRAEYTNGGCTFIDSVEIKVKKHHAFHGGVDDGFSRTGVNFGVALEITPNPVCQYEPVSFEARTTGIETYKYQWYKVGIADPIKDTCCFTIESADLSDAGLYYCAITDGNAKETVLDTVELIVNEHPVASVASATRDTMICYGDEVTLNGLSSLPESHFTWTGEAITTNANNDWITVNPLEPQKYVLTVEKDGCTDTDTMWVSINDHRIYLPDSYIGVEGDLVVFAGLDKAQDTLPSEGVMWYKNGDVAGIEVNPINFLLTGNVNLKGTYTFGECTFADSVQVLVKKNFSFKGGKDDGYSRTALNFGLSIEVDPNPVCEYSPVQFTARTTGIESYNYKWYKVGIADPIKDSCCFTIESVQKSDTGRYYCAITDGNNKITLVDTVQLTVRELPFATIQLSESDTTICFRDSITLTGNSSVPGAVLTWQNTTVGGVVEDHTIRVCPSDSTSYILTARNYDCETKDTVWVNVNHPYVSIPEVVYVPERGDVTLSATNRKGDLIQVDPVEKNMEWTVSGVNKGVINPLKLRALTQDQLVELLFIDQGCPIKDTTLIKVKGGYTYAGGFDDGFARTDTTEHEVFLVFSGSGEYCPGDSARVRLQLVGKKSPWHVTIKRESDGEEAIEIVDNYPLKIYGQDTVLRFEMLTDERYYVEKIADDTLSLGAKDTVTVKQIVPPHIDFRTGWPTSIGYCHDVNLLDSLKPSIDGLYVDANDIIFYVDSVNLHGIVWEVGDFAQGYHTVRCEVIGDNTCPAVSDEINIRLDSIPVGRITLPEVYCEGADTLMEIDLYAGPQEYTIDLVQYRYKKGETTPQVKSRQIKLAAANNGIYREEVKWNTVGSPDSCMIVEITKITDSHGCITDVSALSPDVRQYYYTDTAWWYQKTHTLLQTRYPETAEWKSGDTLFYLPEGDTLEVKLSLITGTTPWYVVSNEVNHYSIQNRDTLFKLFNEGVYRFKAMDRHCEINAEELDTLHIRYPQKGYFRGRLWLEGAYHSEERQMVSSISSKLLSHYELVRWPKTIRPVIDMVEIELREAASAGMAADTTESCKVITRDTCLLLADGRLADRFTGDTLISLRDGYRDDSKEFYMVVTHRNHLSIMTAAPVKIVKTSEKANAVMVDFTVQSNVYCKDCATGSEGLARHMTLIDGHWMMTVGELNKNYLISLSDDNRIGHALGVDIDPTVYDLLYDVNFDGIVDWSINESGTGNDWLIVKKNRGKYSEIITK